MAGIRTKTMRPTSPEHPEPIGLIHVENAWRYKYTSDCPGPKKPGWYYVVDSHPLSLRGIPNAKENRDVRDIYTRWLYRDGRWYDGEVHMFLGRQMMYSSHWPEFWTDEDMLEDSSDWDINSDGAARLLEAILLDWASDYRDTIKKWHKYRDRDTEIKAEKLEYELKRPGILNTCLMGLDPEVVLAHHREHYDERI
jgi:hypothetical protein